MMTTDRSRTAARSRGRMLFWLSLFAIAMAYLESAVVVDLRALYYPSGFAFPLAPMPAPMARIELGRELATLVMLLAVARLMAHDGWEWFLAFCISFGVWDIFYYVWLCVFIGWPSSLFTWDILFLIPVPWIGPVLAPVLVSLGLIVGPVWLLRWKARGVTMSFTAAEWTLAIGGGVVVLVSFMIDYAIVLQVEPPHPFRWDLFSLGFGLGVTAVTLGIRRLRHQHRDLLPVP